MYNGGGAGGHDENGETGEDEGFYDNSEINGGGRNGEGGDSKMRNDLILPDIS